jgi:uncharacterized protein
MRMTNDRDQAILRSAVSDAAANLLDFLPSLGTGEVFAFGEGVPLPARVKLKQLPPHLLPNRDAAGNTQRDAAGRVNEEFFTEVIKRWRGVTIRQQAGVDDDAPHAKAVERPVMAPFPATPVEPNRPGLLKQATVGGLDISRAFQAPARPARAPES